MTIIYNNIFVFYRLIFILHLYIKNYAYFTWPIIKIKKKKKLKDRYRDQVKLRWNIIYCKIQRTTFLCNIMFRLIIIPNTNYINTVKKKNHRFQIENEE